MLGSSLLELNTVLVKLVIALGSQWDLNYGNAHRGGDEVLCWRGEDDEALLPWEAKLRVDLAVMVV